MCNSLFLNVKFYKNSKVVGGRQGVIYFVNSVCKLFLFYSNAYLKKIEICSILIMDMIGEGGS